MSDDEKYPPAEAEALLEQAPWCLLVPTIDPADPDIVGPFATAEEARNWSLSYPGAIIRCMSTPQHEIACHREHEESIAFNKSRN